MPHCHVVCPCASASVCSEAAGTYIARWYIISHNRTTHPSPAQLIRGPIERGGSKVGVSHSKTAHARRTTQAKREAALPSMFGMAQRVGEVHLHHQESKTYHHHYATGTPKNLPPTPP